MSAAVVFDLDGTLIDSARAIRDLTARVMERLGLPPTDTAETRRLVGRGVRAFWTDALAARNAADRLEEALAFFEPLYAAAPAAASPPFPGAGAALAALRDAGHILAICTNKPDAPTRHVIEGHGWGGHFAAIVAGDTLAERKPDPAPLRHAIAATGARRAVFVGDSEIDAATAEAAGVPLLLYTKGYRKSPVETLEHAARFSDFAALPALAARHLDRQGSPA